jgi:hypothetical protein
MALTSTQHNVGSSINFASGTFKDTGSVKKTILKLGFVPRYFKLIDTASTELVFEIFDGMPANDGFKTAAADQTYETSGMPEFIENYDSGAVDTWTVYETGTDNDRLNLVNELFTGVSIPAALVPSSSAMYWVALG